MLRRLKILVAFLCCVLLVNVGSQPRPTLPPIVSPSGTPQADWSILRTLMDQAAYREAVSATPPEPAKKATVRRSGGSVVSYESGSIEALVCSVFGDNCPRALRVARCESGLNPGARNRSGAAGLFQLLGHGDLFETHGWSLEDWADPYKNTVVAFDLSRGGTNWSAWVCR